MATRKQKDELPGDDALTRIYRTGAKDMPPAHLDAAILARASRALAPRSFIQRWAIPASIAAVLVLSVSVVLQISQREEPMLDEVATLTEKTQQPAMTAPAEKKSFAAPAAPASSPEPAKPEAKLAKRAEVEAPRAAAPMPLQRAKSELTSAPPAREQRAAGATADSALTSTADVVAVKASGAPGNYEFMVTLRSADTGCTQYADWWEVLSESGALLYRRILLHSHADEQPFTRNGGPVPIQPDTVVWIRAHMNNGGYGGAAFKGSVKTGFGRTDLARDFAAGLAQQQPLPASCEF